CDVCAVRLEVLLRTGRGRALDALLDRIARAVEAAGEAWRRAVVDVRLVPQRQHARLAVVVDEVRVQQVQARVVDGDDGALARRADPFLADEAAQLIDIDRGHARVVLRLHDARRLD